MRRGSLGSKTLSLRRVWLSVATNQRSDLTITQSAAMARPGIMLLCSLASAHAMPLQPVTCLSGFSSAATVAVRAMPLRRALCISGLSSAAACFVRPPPAAADTGLGYVDNAGAKSYSSVQRAWEKSSTMTNREIMLAARGAGNAAAKQGNESDKSKKRRAMAGCKDDIFRAAASYKDEASCNARVMGGDWQFMLDVMDAE